jgi:hypothetical protein
MKKFFAASILAASVLSFVAVSSLVPVAAMAQATNSGDIRGTVQDSTGALIPDVTVTVTNLNTGITKVLQTNKAGLYDTNSIIVGTYSVTFEHPGFAKFERSKVSLEVGNSEVNAILKIGNVSDVAVVEANDLPLLDTESGTQQTTLEARTIQELPNVGQDWQNFVITVPGTAGLRGNNNPGQLTSANGNLPYSNVLSDGSTTTLGTSLNADVNVFETVQEVQISTSSFSAQYGIGGIIFNQITKGGTNQFHGSAYDYFQSDEFNANGNYNFNSQPTVTPKARYRYNNFGGSIGGPVDLPYLKHKAFFYFDYDQIINNNTGQGTNDIPTAAVMAGQIPSVNPIYDPTTQTIGHDSNGNPYPIRKTFLSEYGTNAIPAALFDKVSTNFQKFYPTMSNHIPGYFQPGTTDAQGVTHKNFVGLVPTQSPSRRYTGRMDYDVNSRNRITGTVVQGDAPAQQINEVTAAPVGYGSQDVSRLTISVSDVATITPNLINEARMGFTYQGNFFSDATLGKGYPAQLGWQYAKADEIPGVQFYTNYPYAWIQPEGGQFVYKENVFDPSDVVTYLKGRHIMHFGGEVGVYRNDNTPYSVINPGTLGFSGNYTANYILDKNGVAQRDFSTGADYADFLLGYANNWSAQTGQEYGARLKNPQIFFQDDFKIRPNLTLNLGIRYQIRLGISETHGNVGTYDPTVVNLANNQLGAYWYGVTHANGRTTLQDYKYSTILPRVGFSYLPHPSMTIRGGFGIYAYNLSLDTYGGSPAGSALGNVSLASGNGSDNSNGTVPYTLFGGPGTVVATGQPLPFAAPGTSPTRFNGQTVQYVAYHTPDPKIYQWNLGIQQAFGSNTVFELSYVASHGFDLNFQTDLNQVPVADNAANNSKYRPNQNYTQIQGSTNDAISNYNSLQAQINHRLSHGLSLSANYTWSHFLDDQDSSGFGSRSGPIARQYQTASQNYSTSNFDIRNQFKARVVYEIPVGRGREFLNHNFLLDEVLGGYQIASTIVLQSGSPFSVFSGGGDGSEPGSSHNPFPDYSGRPLYYGAHTKAEWFDPSAFTLPASGTFGNASRNMLRGPGAEEINMSVGKKFDIYKTVKLQLRVDAINAFNHPSFFISNDIILPLSGGQVAGQAFQQKSFGNNYSEINSTEGARVLQGGLRLEF